MTTMTDPVVVTLQDNALLLMAMHATHEPPLAAPRKRHTVWQAELTGMCEVACDALHLGIAPFGVYLAVTEAVSSIPHPPTTAAFYTMIRDLWKDAIVNDIRRRLDQPRGR